MPAIESDGHSPGNPRIYELIEAAPREGTGLSPTIFAFSQLVDFFKIAGQPVQGPWPPHQQPRPDPAEVEAGPIAVPDPQTEFVPRRRLSIDGPDGSGAHAR